MAIWMDNGGQPVELGEGRGDLRRSSAPFSSFDGAFQNGLPVSYAQVFATQPWVAIAVTRLLTWAVRVPLKLYRRVDDDGARVRVRPDEHPLAKALAGPWEGGSQADLVLSMLGSLCVQGNALTAADNGSANAIRFEPLDWRTVAPTRAVKDDPNSEILSWKQTPLSGQDAKVRSSREVMHLKWWSPLGNIGISPLQQLRSTIIAEAAAVDWTVNNLRNSARPSGMVEFREENIANLEPGARRKLYEQTVEDFRKNYGGPEKAGTLPVLPPFLKWTTADHTTAVEAELLGQRLVNRVEVAAIYQLPPPMIAILERATFSNILTLREMAYTDGLAPPLVLIEQTMNASLLQGLLRLDDYFLEFDFGLILRGDRLKEIKAIREGISSAIYTPNEGRGALNLPASDEPGANDLYLPINNLKPIKEGQTDA